MVNLALLSLLAAQAAGAAPPPVDAAAPPAGTSSPAPSAPAPTDDRKALEDRVRTDLGPQAQPFPSGGLNVGTPGGIPMGKLMLLPEIAVVVDGALGYTTLSEGQQLPTADPWPQHKAWPALQEVELALQATVDPYVRGDVFLTFSDAGVAIEEAFLTTLSLPAGLQIKAGKIYTPFGRTSQLHRHQWTFVDQPLSMQRLVGAEGLKGAGGDLAWLAPLPWFAELHLAYQATSPGFDEAVKQLTGTARLVQYVELSDEATLGVGFSWSYFQAAGPAQWRNLAGADVYLKIRDPASRSHVVLQGEIYGRQLDGQPWSLSTWGGYGQASWRIDRNWEVGARYDAAPPPVAFESGTQQTWTALGSWAPSEFFRLRLQPSLVLLPERQTGFQGILSFEFTIGAHGAHPF
ncbi:MAG TPA: hypothetical protein VFM53_04190 [Anaeromyxobacteraceae bacterium]|nr:hypothetical protein [Anaeromyxobacteraceae bacterium]